MRNALSIAVCVVGMAGVAGPVAAQEGLATSSGIQGHNTIQQAPSGGRVGAGTAGLSGTTGRGEPTVEERQTEKHNNDVTQICKGC